MKNLSGEKYIIMVTYPGYVDMIDTLSLDPNASRDLGNVFSIQKKHTCYRR